MGQASSIPNKLDIRVEDPGPRDGATGTAAECVPRGLALIAHGRFGNKDRPLVRGLAEYFRDERQLRVVTWDDLQAGGRGMSEDFQIWTGEVGADDYNRILHEAMAKFVADFPNVQHPELFICGYSAGAISAGRARPPPPLIPHFSHARYVLVSYPVDASFCIALQRTGSCFRSVEALVQGHGWQHLPGVFGGTEPEVAGVLTITGVGDMGWFYGVWTGILGQKNARGNLCQVVVEGVGHVWEAETVGWAVGEVRKWLA